MELQNINKIEENIKNKEKIFNLLENNSSLNIIFRYYVALAQEKIPKIY